MTPSRLGRGRRHGGSRTSPPCAAWSSTRACRRRTSRPSNGRFVSYASTTRTDVDGSVAERDFASAIEVYQFDGTALRLLDCLAVARAAEHLTVFPANAGRLVLSGVAAGGGGGAAYNFDARALP